ncbi:MAG: cation transporter [Gammaproteobacteria bacterium]|nr:cation transporter [Gammaproteobacteria bacterium]
MQRIEPQERAQISKRVTLVGALINVLLSVIKIIFGLVAQSHALIVDGIHSLSDLLSDAMVWFASHHSQHEPDEKHPYGHGRFETGATLGLGLLLILVAVGVIWDSVERLFSHEQLLNPGPVALFVAIFSVLSKEVLYHYTIRAGRRIGSKMLQANAWHHRTDAVSSIVVVVGIGGTMAGLPYLDTMAALVVSVMIAHVGWELGWPAFEELMDVGLGQEGLEKVKEIIHSVDGVEDIHMLRTRSMGGQVAMDVHVLVEPWLSVTEGHMIGQTVMDRLLEQVEEVNDVTVHIDPEDDELAPPTKDLPLRKQTMDELYRIWSAIPQFGMIQRTILHYRDGKIDIDLYFPLSCYTGEQDAGGLHSRLQGRLSENSIFGELNLFFG